MILTPNVWRRCRLRLDVFHALRENLSSALTAGIGAKVVRHGERGNEASAMNGLSNLSKRTVGRRCHRYAAMNTLRSIVASTALLTLPAAAEDHRFEADPVVTVRENFVACDVLSQLQRVMDNPRFLLTGECEPLSAGRRVRIYASRGHAVQMDTRESAVEIVPQMRQR